MYWEAMTVIDAQEKLLALKVADYPNMKGEARLKIHREWHRLAYPKTHDASGVLSTEQLAQRLKVACGE